jgi:AcrR family transcriptional regulator
MQPVTTTQKRTYNSTRRRRQAEQTRSEILLTAMRLFGERGWAGTTLAEIAEEAGVAVETIYSNFGSKRALLRQAMDVAVVGDAEPVAFVDRPEFRRIGEGTLDERMDAATDFLADTFGRSAGVYRALLDAADGDEELTAWVNDSEQRRRLDVRRSLERIFDHEVDATVVDLLWVLFSSDTYRKLVAGRGYSRDQYRAAMDVATRSLVQPGTRSGN